MSRGQSLRILYDKLQASKDYQNLSIKSYAESLIDSLQSILESGRNINIIKNISEFNVSSKEMVSIGMIINELISNAYKYAFAENDSGLLSVLIDKKDNIVSIIIQDDGIGINENMEFSGLGLSIVKLLAEQLNGSMSIKSDHGSRISIRIKA